MSVPLRSCLPLPDITIYALPLIIIAGLNGMAIGLTLNDLQTNSILEMKSASSPLSAPFNLTNVSLTLPTTAWDSCRMDSNNEGKVVLVTLVSLPCTIQDWQDMCQANQCAGLILHTLYATPGLVLSHRVSKVVAVEVSNHDGLLINNLLSSGHPLSVSMDSFQTNEWVQYFESREFIWAMTMPSFAGACICILNFLKMKEKMGGLLTWRSIPAMHIALVAAESAELGFRSALGFGLGTTKGAGFSFEYFILFINLVIVIYTMSNLTLGLTFRDLYCSLMQKPPPLNAYLKVATFILCSVIFVLHYVYNIIPRKTGNDQWRLPVVGYIWVVMVVGTVALFLISAVKLSLSFRTIQGDTEDNTWILRQVSIRLLQCAMGMTIDLIIIAVIVFWTYHSSPRLLLLSISIAGWSQNFTSILKMRAILVPTLPKRQRQIQVRIHNHEEDRSSMYLPVSFEGEKSQENVG